MFKFIVQERLPGWSVSVCCLCVGGFWAPYATFVSISVGYAIVAGSLVAFVEPLAAGSGIPEIKTYLNGIHIKGLLTVCPKQCPKPDSLMPWIMLLDTLLCVVHVAPRLCCSVCLAAYTVPLHSSCHKKSCHM